MEPGYAIPSIHDTALVNQGFFYQAVSNYSKRHNMKYEEAREIMKKWFEKPIRRTNENPS